MAGNVTLTVQSSKCWKEDEYKKNPKISENLRVQGNELNLTC